MSPAQWNPQLRRPRASTASIPELLVDVQGGRVRIPDFQRKFKWKRKNIRELFDSIWRGIPIGTLLLWQRAAEEQMVHLGPLRFAAPARSDAWFVVDGQQRLTSLAGVLLPEQRDDAQPDFDLYFNLEKEIWVHASSASQPLPEHWLPARVALSNPRLNRWLRSRALPEVLEARADQVSHAIQSYTIPLYVIETDSAEDLRFVFDRVNNAGERLNWIDSMDALLGDRRAIAPSSIEDLVAIAQQLNFGQLPPRVVGKCVQAAQRWDLTRDFHDSVSMESIRAGEAFALTVEPLRSAILFLREDASIPHHRLLPYALPLFVLVRFFREHPSPDPWSRQLLVRWVWRGCATRLFAREHAPMVRAALRVFRQPMRPDMHALALLQQVGGEDETELDLTTRFDARAAASRIQLAALAQAGPRSLVDDAPLDVSSVLSAHAASSFPRIFSRQPAAMSGEVFSSIVNRLLHPPRAQSSIRAQLRARHPAPSTLRSHLLPGSMTWPPSERVLLDAMQHRAQEIAAQVQRFLSHRCAWDQRDRPSLQTLRAMAEEE